MVLVRDARTAQKNRIKMVSATAPPQAPIEVRRTTLRALICERSPWARLAPSSRSVGAGYDTPGGCSPGSWSGKSAHERHWPCVGRLARCNVLHRRLRRGNPEDGGQVTLVPPQCIDADAGARDADRASQANDDAVAAINALDFDRGIAKLREAASAWRAVASDASADPAVVVAASGTAQELGLSASALSQGDVDSATDHALGAFSGSSRVVEALQNSTVPFC
jgi:hypothetical protein